MDASNESIGPVIATALDTGTGRNEMINLKWNQVNLQESSITVEDTRNKEFRIIPISSLQMEAFEGLERRGEYVFTKDYGSRILSFRTAFENEGACSKEGFSSLSTTK